MATPEDILVLKQLWEQNLVSQSSLDAPLKNFCKDLLKGKKTSLSEILVRSGLIASKDVQLLQENSKQILKEIAPEMFLDKAWNVRAEDCSNLVKMGDSALGNTYSASHQEVNACVIKYIEGIIANNRKFLKRFFIQLEKLAKLKHENIADIYTVSYSNLQIIREYVVGQNIKEYVNDNEISLFQACMIISDIAKGLHFAYQNNILHKNLKPSNIIIDEDQNVKIVDFSLPPTVPSYLSPEQCLKQKSDMRADIYSLGLIFYLILTGEPAIKANDTKEIMNAITSGHFAQSISSRNDISEEIAEILQKMLSTNPESRYSDYIELIDALEQYKSDSKINIKRSLDENMMHTAEIALSADDRESLNLDLPENTMMALEAEDVEEPMPDADIDEEIPHDNDDFNKDEPMEAVALDDEDSQDLNEEIVISARPLPKLTAAEVKNAPEQKMFELEEPQESQEEEDAPAEEGNILFKKKNKLKPYFPK